MRLAKPKIYRPCLHCGKWRSGNANLGGYCKNCAPSRIAQRSARRYGPFTCLCCQEQFFAKEGNRDKYCSRACSYAQKSVARNMRRHWKCKPYMNHCGCGKRIGLRAVRCSGCRPRPSSATLERYGLARWERNTKGKVTTCLVCGIEWCWLYKGIGKFCSPECKSEHRRATQRKWRGKLRNIDPAEIVKRDGGMCMACLEGTPFWLRKADPRHKSAPHIDHITPRAKGGLDVATNLQTLCAPCNELKSDRDMAEFMLTEFGEIAYRGWMFRYMETHQPATLVDWPAGSLTDLGDTMDASIQASERTGEWGVPLWADLGGDRVASFFMSQKG